MQSLGANIGGTDGQESEIIYGQESQERSERRSKKSEEGSAQDAQISRDVKSYPVRLV